MRSFSLAALSLVTTAILAPSLALADEFCEDLWFTRNAIMDRAGYCFGSKLGQAIFDNSDCLGKTVSLSAEDQEMVAELQALEREGDCRVDTSKGSLSLPDLAQRQALWHLPLRDISESACLGWRGKSVGLHAGPGKDTPVIGKITPGDTIGYSYLPQGDWDYVQVFDSNWVFKSAGWTDLHVSPQTCSDIAG
ncbi:DUF4453 domain-containing protein [Pseudophaeobacter sp.]|uniref:DUF4453 domain-containing protein n=1 Tax=Pseudophaeobacter sp. TaxID=1971739 RepID=UPI00329819FB